MTGCTVGAANVILTAGAQNGVFATSLCLLEAGDEVIVPEPMYLTYEACVRAAGATSCRCRSILRVHFIWIATRSNEP